MRTAVPLAVSTAGLMDHRLAILIAPRSGLCGHHRAMAMGGEGARNALVAYPDHVAMSRGMDTQALVSPEVR